MEKNSFWSNQPGIAIKGYLWIYISTVVFTYLLNMYTRALPLSGLFWFDSVCIMLWVLLWVLFFPTVGNWPFSKIKNKYLRGTSLVVACFILAWISIYSLYAIGLGADWQFPILGTAYVVLVFFGFTGEMWPWAHLPKSRQFFFMLLTILGFTWLTCVLDVLWIPAWWFPFCQCLAGTGLHNYLFRKVKQPLKSTGTWLIMFLAATVWIYFSNHQGIWDYSTPQVSAFWNWGSWTMEGLLLFYVSCCFIYGILTPAQNWPFRKIKMPWGGILASAFCWILVYIVWGGFILAIDVGIMTMEQALTYGYMGVLWSFIYPLFFGVGFEKPYLWAGQKTPGTWEDVD